MDSRAWLTDYKSLPEGNVAAYAEKYADEAHLLDCYNVIEKSLSNADLAGSIGKFLMVLEVYFSSVKTRVFSLLAIKLASKP